MQNIGFLYSFVFLRWEQQVLCLFIIELERNIYILVSAFGRTTKTKKKGNKKQLYRTINVLPLGAFAPHPVPQHPPHGRLLSALRR
jgi:hypothetical protein